MFDAKISDSTFRNQMWIVYKSKIINCFICMIDTNYISFQSCNDSNVITFEIIFYIALHLFA